MPDRDYWDENDDYCGPLFDPTKKDLNTPTVILCLFTLSVIFILSMLLHNRMLDHYLPVQKTRIVTNQHIVGNIHSCKSKKSPNRLYAILPFLLLGLTSCATYEKIYEDLSRINSEEECPEFGPRDKYALCFQTLRITVTARW